MPPSSTTKADLIHAFANNPSPADAVPWTVQEEMELVDLQSLQVGMINTALGVATKQMARGVTQKNLATLDPETRAMLKRALEDGEDGDARGILQVK
jgi:spore coat protein CotF